MMGMEWLIWVVVALVVFRVVTGPRRWRRRWLWDDDWLGGPYGGGRLPGGPGRGRHGHGRSHRLDRRRAALEEAADRLEEASERLRSKARGRRPTADEGRATLRSSSSGSGRLPGSAAPAGTGEGSPAGRRAPARKPPETPLEALQRRFAEGRITMEQYERELDKLYGLN